MKTAVAVLALVFAHARAASDMPLARRSPYMTVGMSEARQCNVSLVEWYGDDGPYHLLLTPTQFVSHGYNVWIPSIPNGTNSYSLSINQPAGLQYMVTVWGASGIEYAGTTDVLTVQPSENKDCFLSDDTINGLYTFAFNISNSDGFPPQCSNLSISWPTSLESNITSDMRRSVAEGEADEEWTGWDEEEGEEDDATDDSDDDTPSVIRMRGFGGAHVKRHEDREIAEVTEIAPALPIPTSTDTSSSNKTSGNTTLPPTMFGIIPLGNSFSIPITYGRDVKFADELDEESLSDDPSTWTRAGVTHLNWTVSLTKGTRFILVAGIGAAQEWASGGSSEMMTVGQGSFGCFNQDAPNPGVTASSSTGALSRPTSGAGGSNAQTGGMSATSIVIACVFSALGTLAAVIFLYCCCRVRSQRRRARKNGLPRPSLVNLATFGRLEKRSFINRNRDRGAYAPGNRDSSAGLARLDLLETESRPGSTWSRGARVGSTNSRPGTDYDSPVDIADAYAYDLPFAPYAIPVPGSPVSPISPSSPMMEYPQGYTHVPSPGSPAPRPAAFENRRPSLDPLVYPPMPHAPPPRPAATPLSPPSPLAPTPIRRGPLVLHDPSALSAERDAAVGADRRESRDGGGGAQAEDITTLKRDTLAALPPRVGESSSRPRRRRTDDDVIVLHRDAGRIRRIEELPPRYDELDWDAEAPIPRRASSVPVVAPSPRPATFAGSPSVSPRPSPSPQAHSPRFGGHGQGGQHVYGSALSPVLSGPSVLSGRSGAPRESPSSMYEHPTPWALDGYQRPLSLASMDDREGGRASPNLPPGAAPPRPPRSPMSSMDSPRRSPRASPHLSPLGSPHRSPLESPVPTRHSMA